MRTFFSFVVVGILVFGSIYLFLQKPAPPRYQGLTSIQVGDVEFEVYIADTKAKRRQGLSGTESLGAGEGMLFVFDTSSEQGFWMKDMNYPIDIVWIGEDSRVRGVLRNISPDTYPEVFYSPGQILYVLEVGAGVSEEKNIEIGDKLEFKHK